MSRTPRSHSHRPSSAGTVLHHAEQVCRERGLLLTPLRRRVFEALAASEAPLGAYDLVERLGRERRIAPISVYRTLDFLIEAGLIHRIATRNAYLPCHHTHAPHETTLFLVCTRCGGVDEVASPEVARGIGSMAVKAGFRADDRAVEVAGECKTCRTTSA